MAWTVFVLVLMIALVYQIRQTILVFAGAVFFSYILWPLVSFVQSFTTERRGIALAIVYMLLIGAIVGIGFAVIPAIAYQATSLFTRLPSLITGAQISRIPLPSFLEPVRNQVVEAVRAQAATIGSRVILLMQEAGTHLLSGFSLIVPIVLIPIFSFFFIKDGNQMKETFVSLFPDTRSRAMVELIMEDMHSVLKNYIRALVILSLISFCMYSLVLKLIGIQYELLIAGLAALLEFIPVIGPVIVLAILVILTTVTAVGKLLWVVLFWGVYRFLQDYMLNPFLMRAGLELHPLLVLFGVLAGDQIGGVPGMFFSVPVLATLKVIYLHAKMSGARRHFTSA
ncbi:MAG: AI-2E family transporter [Acidobacteriaceae bacterium]|nr:AI-2E family transporter [Acidobacteriaceae bacterium]MBV8570710.1 AI-2E family transporter [Acidobacteriaceae bacterium]